MINFRHTGRMPLAVTSPPDLKSTVAPLLAPLESLGHISAFHAKRLKSLVGPRVIDLLFHLPSGRQNRHVIRHLGEAQPGSHITLVVTPQQQNPGSYRGAPFRVMALDSLGNPLELVFYHSAKYRAMRDLPLGQPRLVSGKWERYGSQDQIVHPDGIRPIPANLYYGQRVEPQYPLTAGLTMPVIQATMRSALAEMSHLQGFDDAWLDGTQPSAWPTWRNALLSLHKPQPTADPIVTQLARERLSFDELFVHQLGLQLAGLQRLRQSGVSLEPCTQWQAQIESQLPFQLTQGQRTVLQEIRMHMRTPQKTVHLLQGDVGSGKTLVALFLMLDAVAAGHQAALLVPTEILADQHAASLRPWLDVLGLEMAVMKGKLTVAHKRKTRQRLADGEISLVIGTHALLEDDVAFKDLGLVVIDEQHRFGVEQRMALVQKSKLANVLLMTATPIPRTLLLASYGDLSCSRLTDKPAGRSPIDTRVMPRERMPDVIDALKRVVERGERVYWICPLIEDSETSDLAAAELRFASLAKQFVGQVALVHGRMKTDERSRAMDNFRTGETPILVATTVIEVGVDVPEATVMVIEHAERFGLAQLHQLRGRVGRSHRPSSCILLYAPPLSPTSQARLEALRTSNDGFAIAEIDLKLRGSGEVLGAKQSGELAFRIATEEDSQQWMELAFQMARKHLSNDPELRTSTGQAIRCLLHLFHKENFALSGVERA